MARDRKTLVMGVGNELMGDDGVGVVVARMVREKGIDGITAIECGTVPENFWGVIQREDPDRVIIVDAIDFGGEPGEARVYTVYDLVGGAGNTHNPSLEFFVKSLGERDVLIVGVQPGVLEYDKPLSSPVRDRLGDILKLIEDLAAE